VVWLTWEAHHSDRFGQDRGPTPVRIRNIFMWIAVIFSLAMTYWETHHGNTNYYHPKMGAR